MTENNGEQHQDAPPTPQQPSPVIEIKIRWNMATGESEFEGPIGNKTICYGMLEVAKKMVDTHVNAAAVKANQGIIQRIMGVHNGVPPRGFRGHPGK